jgi:hypothetical protein
LFAPVIMRRLHALIYAPIAAPADTCIFLAVQVLPPSSYW